MLSIYYDLPAHIIWVSSEDDGPHEVRLILIPSYTQILQELLNVNGFPCVASLKVRHSKQAIRKKVRQSVVTEECRIGHIGTFHHRTGEFATP